MVGTAIIAAVLWASAVYILVFGLRLLVDRKWIATALAILAGIALAWGGLILTSEVSKREQAVLEATLKVQRNLIR